MGRRAKNKQGPPQPLQAEASLTSDNGKRKASDDGASAGRPNKKLKNVLNKSKNLLLSKSKPAAGNGKGWPQKDRAGKKLQKVQFQKNENEDEGSGEGWEDVGDGVGEADLKAQARSLFHGSGDEFQGGLDELEDDDDETEADEPLRGSTQEFDFSSSDDSEGTQLIPSKIKKSRQFERPSKMVPTASDASDSDEEDGKITMANMEARSLALDAVAAAEAELDAEELRQAAPDVDGKDVDMDDDDGEIDGVFQFPTASEREEEKAKGGPDLQTVQQRMRYCVSVLGNFKKRAKKGQ